MNVLQHICRWHCEVLSMLEVSLQAEIVQRKIILSLGQSEKHFKSAITFHNYFEIYYIGCNYSLLFAQVKLKLWMNELSMKTNQRKYIEKGSAIVNQIWLLKNCKYGHKNEHKNRYHIVTEIVMYIQVYYQILSLLRYQVLP